MEFLYLLESIRNSVLNIFFIICTSFGEELVLISLFALIYWCINKTLAYKIAFSYFLSGVVIQGLKVHFRVERPWIIDPDFKPVESVLDTATGYSFPSGHTQSSTSLYSSIAFHFKKKNLYVLSFVVIMLVMLSRMYLGCHTPKDVLVSFAVTLLISLMVSLVFDNLNSALVTDLLVMVLTIVLSAALCVYSYHLVNTGATTEVLAMDGFKAAGAGIGFGFSWFIEKRFVRFTPKNSRKGIQFLKILLGLGVAAALKVGLKLLLGDTIVGNCVRYFVIVLWVVAVFPFIIKKCFNDRF